MSKEAVRQEYKHSTKHAEARSRRVRRAIKGIKESLEGEIESNSLGIEGKCRAILALGNTARARYGRSEKLGKIEESGEKQIAGDAERSKQEKAIPYVCWSLRPVEA